MGESDKPASFDAPCPVPVGKYAEVVLGHGAGGRLSRQLLEQVFLAELDDPVLAALEDQAVVPALGEQGGDLAFTTDGFVVRPLEFPGGNVGRLAICGTVNDLCVGGAVPKYVSAAFILEEGLPMDRLRRIVAAMRDACVEARVRLVAGDTKVVERGKGDGVFIATSGIGVRPRGVELGIGRARPGDRVLVSGPIGDHGIAILSKREGLEFDTELVSDVAPLCDLTRVMLEACPSIRCMRDATRGGVSSVLLELAAASQVGIQLDERDVPVRDAVRGACEMLGLDPLYVACEGRLVAVVPESDAERLIEVVRAHPLGAGASLCARVVADHPGTVIMRSAVGGRREVPELSGEQLPRIC